jgi:hypothetical protein
MRVCYWQSAQHYAELIVVQSIFAMYTRSEVRCCARRSVCGNAAHHMYSVVPSLRADYLQHSMVLSDLSECLNGREHSER